MLPSQYAHTINGHTYNYVAYAVYEGSTTTVDGQTVLTSTSGTTPAVSQTRATFRGYAHNYTMSSTLADNPTYPAYSMLWNFDQWQLYKDIAFAVMENTNSQNIVGNGHVYTSNSQYAYTTGALDASGPYAGNPTQITDNTTAASYGSDSAKLFIENAWGGVYDFVDGVVINAKSAAYIDSSSTPNDATSGTYITNVSWTLPSSGYSNSIQTGDARVWGFPGSTAGGSATTGLADYIYTSTNSNRVLDVGGYASSAWSASVLYGLSSSVADDVSYSAAYIGARLAFVFDAAGAAAEPVDLTFGISDTGYGTIGDGTQTGQTTIALTGVTNGTALTVSGNALTVSDVTPTVITATPTTSDDHWTYAFDGWYIGTSKIVSTTTVTADTTINAKFTRTLTTHTATVESNNINYGTVSVGQLTGIPYGETFTVDGSTLSIYNQSVVALTTTDTVRYEYSFDGFETEGTLITTGLAMTSDMTIRAIFSCEELVYTVVVQSNNVNYGTVTNAGSYSGIPGGSPFTVNGTNMQLTPVDGTPISFTANTKAADAQYTYAFTGWYDALQSGNQITTGTQVTSNMTVYAIFTATTNTYTVSAVSNETDFGTVDHDSVTNVPYGTVVTINSNTLNINGTTVTATPNQPTVSTTYSFQEWRVNGTPVTTSYTINGPTTFTAVFNDGEVTYQVNFSAYPTEYGSLSPSVSYLNVPYGSQFTVNGSSITLDDTTITATPTEQDEQYIYAFVGWYNAQTGGSEITSLTTVTGGMNAYARFSVSIREYTVSAESNNTSLGTVDNTTISNVPYGTIVTINSNTLSINGTTVTATPKTSTASVTYSFQEWKVDNTAVTGTYTVEGPTTFTAVFVSEGVTYQVNFSAYPTEYGTITPTTSQLTVPYGSQFTVNNNRLTLDSTQFTATAKAQDAQYTYSFDGWYDAQTGGNRIATGTTVTANMNIYAIFNADVRSYTVYAQSNNPDFGTVSPSQSAMQIPYGSVVTVGTNSISMNGTVVFTATPASETSEYIYSLSKWQMNGTDIVSGTTTTTGAVTFTAVFIQGTDENTAVLRFNMNGGSGSLEDQSSVRSGSESSTTFTIPDYEPSKNNYSFEGWATTPDASDAEYEPGDTIEVSYGQVLMLYAVYEPGTIVSIIEMLPYIAAVGIVVGLLGGMYVRFKS